MATSRSIDPAPVWRAGAQLFSGRPDPEWSLTPVRARALVAAWDSLHAIPSDAVPVAPVLGYRGCRMSDGAGRTWRAGQGLVLLQHEGVSSARADPDRRFERAILASAPPGVLPADLRRGII